MGSALFFSSRFRRRLAKSAAVTVAGASLIGAIGAPASSAATTPKIHAGGTATFVNAGLGAQIDPAFDFMINFTDSQQMQAVYGPGLDYLLPSSGKVVMGFAQSITPSNHNKTWTIVLHKGLKFSDGTPFNAAAIAANFKRLADPATGSSLRTLAAEITPHVVNATTLRATLTAPNAQFPSLVATDFAAIPSPTAVAAEGTTAFGNKPVGPGPFVLQSVVSGVSNTFTKNPYYKLYAPGQPYLSGITIEEQTSFPQQLADLQTGQAQMADPTTGQEVQQIRGAGIKVAYHQTDGGGWLALSQKQAPFNNKVAREAVYDALNRTAVANVWAPQTPVQTNFFPKSSPLYNSKINWPASNPAQAQSLFNQLAASGNEVNFAVLWPAGTNFATASYVESALSSFSNVKVSVNQTLVAPYVQALQSANYQMTAYGAYYPSLFPGLAQVFQTGGALNYAAISDPILDKQLTLMQSANTTAGLKTAVNAFFKELIAQYDIIPTQQSVVGYAYTSAIGGVKAVELGTAPLWGQLYHT